VSRARVARLALGTYPAGDARTDEMLATLLDASADSRTRFLRELVDVVRLGLRARATQTARAGATRLVADGLRLAAVWLMALDLTTLLAWRYRGLHDPLLGWPSIALLAGVLALALIGFDRGAGAGALLWTALRLPALLHVHPGLAGVAAEVLPALCFAAMVIRPRRPRLQLWGVLWLLVPLALVVGCGPSRDDQNLLILALAALAAVAVVGFALAMLPTDPRLALAGAVGLSQLAITVVTTHHDASTAILLSLAAAPATLALAIARTRRLQRLGSL
jgi:hypothetical protein